MAVEIAPDAESRREEGLGKKFGRFDLLERIGVGGMAEVWKARVAGVGGFEKILVLKKILPAFAQNKTFIQMLLAEARLCAVLQHANIVQTYENGEIEGQYYIAMEYVPGHDLFKMLSRATQVGRRLPPEICLFVAAEVAKGLGYAHEAKDHRGRPLNIIHRDVSPSNVLISHSGEVKVMDFGVARATMGGNTTEASTRSGVLKGKLGYMSPEQVTGQPFDRRSDIFSLGIILYESITLKRLFLGRTDLETLVNIRDARIEHKFRKHSYIDEGVRAILRKTLTRNPSDRYDSALDLHDDIINLLFEAKIQVSNRSLSEFVIDLFDPEEPQEDEADEQVKPAGQTTRRTSAVVAVKRSKSTRSLTFSAEDVARDRAAIRRRREQALGTSPAGGEEVSPAASVRALELVEETASQPEDTDPELAARLQGSDGPDEGGDSEPHTSDTSESDRPAWTAESAAFQALDEDGLVLPGGGEVTVPDGGPRRRQSAVEAPEMEIPPALGTPEEQGGTAKAERKEVPSSQRASFHIRTGDGQVIGPITTDHLGAMVRSRAVSSQSLVSGDAEHFEPVAEGAELQEAIEHVSQRQPPVEEGKSSRINHARLLYRLWARRFTGSLELRHGEAQKCVYMRRGRPCHIASNQKSEMLGPFLISQGFVGQADVQRALDHIQAHGGRLGDVLIGLGLLQPFQLYQVLERQFRAKFIDAFAWDDVGYAIFDGEALPDYVVPLDLDPIVAMVEGVRDKVPLSMLEPHFKDHMERSYGRVEGAKLTVESFRFQARETKASGMLLSSHTLRQASEERCRNRQQKLALLHVALLLLQTEVLAFVTE